MIELMHQMALSPAKTSIHGQDIVSTVEMVLKPTEKLKESFAEPPTDQNTI
jgi:hypothetical protein